MASSRLATCSILPPTAARLASSRLLEADGVRHSRRRAPRTSAYGQLPSAGFSATSLAPSPSACLISGAGILPRLRPANPKHVLSRKGGGGGGGGRGALRCAGRLGPFRCHPRHGVGSTVARALIYAPAIPARAHFVTHALLYKSIWRLRLSATPHPQIFSQLHVTLFSRPLLFFHSNGQGASLLLVLHFSLASSSF